MPRKKPAQPAKIPLREMTTAQLREQVKRGKLLVEASMYDTAYGCNELEELGWPGASGWVVGGSSACTVGTDRGLCWGFSNEREHIAHVNKCRQLAYFNPFAKNAIENLISYICGAGFTYKALPRDKDSASDRTLAEKVQAAMDDAVDEFRLGEIEQEAVRRCERDGEVVLVAYENDDKEPELRFREPSEMCSPSGTLPETQGQWSFGIDIDPDDAAIIHGYCIGGKYIEADRVYHVKANVDSNVPRGISTLWTPLNALKAAMQSLDAVTRTATIQSSIPYIRYHDATPGVVGAMIAGNADVTRTKANGNDATKQGMKPGTVIDASAKTKYEFPTTSVDVQKMTEAVQANLRAAASAMVLPEWMLTGRLDGKYSNAEISEGPTGYMVNRKQATYTGRFREIMVGVILVSKGFTEAELKRVKVAVVAPGTGQGQTTEEAQVSETQFRNGVLSRETWQAAAGLDPEREKANLAREDDILLGGGNPTNPNDNPEVPAPVPA